MALALRLQVLGPARGLNRDQAVQISRLSSGESFVGKRKEFVFNAFAYFKPM